MAAQAPLVGRQLGACRLERQIGSGTFADVYAARRGTDGRAVAVKVMRPSLVRHPEFQARFQREAEIASRLDHPSIVRVHEYEAGGGTPFMVMDLLTPDTLAGWIALGEPLRPPVQRWIAQVADAVDYAHRQGVVHRDLKPANVLVSSAEARAYLTDFGIARILDVVGLTATGMAIGSYSYMSPEQCRGLTRQLDHRADVYSLAVTLFEIATGRPPFGRGPAALAGHLAQPPPPALRLNPALPPAVEAVLHRGLAKEPEARYQSAGALAGDFLAALTGA